MSRQGGQRSSSCNWWERSACGQDRGCSGDAAEILLLLSFPMLASGLGQGKPGNLVLSRLCVHLSSLLGELSSVLIPVALPDCPLSRRSIRARSRRFRRSRSARFELPFPFFVFKLGELGGSGAIRGQ
jgi:hypothetical protein